MNPVEHFSARIPQPTLVSFWKRVAQRMHDEGHKCLLICSRCLKSQSLSLDDVAAWLGGEMPVCCGETMDFVRRRES